MVRKVDYYYTRVANRAGQGARLLETFLDAGVSFRAVHAFPEGGRAQVDLFPKDRGAFLRAARKAGIKLSPRRTAFLVEGSDRVGAVARVLKKLGDAGVNVTALTGIATGRRYGMLLWVRRGNENKAARILRAKR